MSVPRFRTFGPFFSDVTFLPREKLCVYSMPSRQTVTSIRSDSALTTLDPTPWRPPETL